MTTQPNHLRNLKVGEISVVPRPAVPGARIGVAKAQDEAGSAEAQLESLAQQIAKQQGVGVAKGYDLALQQRPDLYVPALREAAAEAQKALAEYVPPSSGPAPAGAEAQLEGIAKAIAAAEGLSLAKALDAAIQRNPALYRAARPIG